jgi:hypothetical protein
MIFTLGQEFSICQSLVFSTYYLLPTAYCLLPTTYYLLLTTYFLLLSSKPFERPGDGIEHEILNDYQLVAFG